MASQPLRLRYQVLVLRGVAAKDALKFLAGEEGLPPGDWSSWQQIARAGFLRHLRDTGRITEDHGSDADMTLPPGAEDDDEGAGL
jgi:hypothetical protein